MGELIAGRLPTTIELGLVALIVGVLIGVPIGIYSAVRQDTVGDYVGRSFAIIIIYSITIGWAIIAEASLSFLGFGLPPDVPSWGTMLSREGRQYMEMAPRLAMWPGVALTLVVYCLNMVGDALRDLLDPRLRGGGGVAGGVGARAAERATRALRKLERSR